MTVPPFLTGNQIRHKFLDFYAQRGHEILPSASLVPEDPTVLLTIAGMLQFKPIFLGQRRAEFLRATTSQKCIRTNDIENVGRTARHHTFFEMLGNFSFGDYFKEKAIAYAWELSTQVYRLAPERLVVSVFREDDEAFAIWRDQIGIPAHRIQRMDEADNFWVSGATGPCGPCSEIYYDFHPELGDEQIDLEDDTRFIEFYNLVFMQYNRDIDGNLTPLEKQNIDTGLGLERMAQILQRVPNNYETDLIFPIIAKAADLAHIDYSQAPESTKVSLKVIGDHVRSVVQMIADGITAANVGRGYILRRLIRRVVRHGRLLGITTAFITQVAETAIALGEEAYPQIREREQVIKNELAREEARFSETLERGEKLLTEIIAKISDVTEGMSATVNAGKAMSDVTEGISATVNTGKAMSDVTEGMLATANIISNIANVTKIISGVDAFVLYDTYGFPLELTQEIAEEQGLTVDAEGFAVEMEKQRERSQSAHEVIDLTAHQSLEQLGIKATEFLGYTDLGSPAMVQTILLAGEPVSTATVGEQVQIILNRTPFYGESGGQIGDRGTLISNQNSGQEKTGSTLFVRITNVQKQAGVFIHLGVVERGTLETGKEVMAVVDRACRRRSMANHTATHLLQAALRKIVDPGISQAGSLVDFDRLRFDFNLSRAVTTEELQTIEDLVNTWISEAHPAQVEVMPIDVAKAKGAIAMFGEKYGAEVRVVDYLGISMELCGGTHVDNTAEIGVFKIVGETGIAAGIRRIEAVAGAAVLDYLQVRELVVRELGDRFKAKPEELPQRVSNLQAELKAAQKQLETLKQEMAILQSDQLLQQVESIDGLSILVAQMGDTDAESLKAAATRLLQKLGQGAVVLASIPEPDKINFVAALSPELNQKGLQAGKLVGEIAKLCGGGGGGRPNLAQAGGKNVSKLPEALALAKERLIG